MIKVVAITQTKGDNVSQVQLSEVLTSFEEDAGKKPASAWKTVNNDKHKFTIGRQYPDMKILRLEYDQPMFPGDVAYERTGKFSRNHAVSNNITTSEIDALRVSDLAAAERAFAKDAVVAIEALN